MDRYEIEFQAIAKEFKTPEFVADAFREQVSQMHDYFVLQRYRVVKDTIHECQMHDASAPCLPALEPTPAIQACNLYLASVVEITDEFRTVARALIQSQMEAQLTGKANAMIKEVGYIINWAQIMHITLYGNDVRSLLKETKTNGHGKKSSMTGAEIVKLFGGAAAKLDKKRAALLANRFLKP